MNAISHKPGIHENYLVTRRLALKGLEPAETAALTAQLKALMEVDEAAVSPRGDRALLTVSYDASTHPHPLKEIETLITAHGATLSDSWWNRFKRSYYTFTDQNVFDNARQEPWCCHHPPKK